MPSLRTGLNEAARPDKLVQRPLMKPAMKQITFSELDYLSKRNVIKGARLALNGTGTNYPLLCEVAMYWDVTTVKPLANYRIQVEIADGRRGIFDLKPYLNHGVFRELQDVNYFNQVGILFGAVTWPHEQDIAPETLAAEMQAIELNE